MARIGHQRRVSLFIVNTYTWNARNQLTQISQGSTVEISYAYDALGRRIGKTVSNGTPTQFLYDGANAVQETQGSSINAILTGLGVDGRFARSDVTGRTYFVTDALNSTIALTDPTGAIREQYSYDPYGNVTQSDTTTGFTNPYQFMGREADAPGLYYYRARYYSPMMAGFISEDPAGFAGGQLSFYAAFRGDPLDFNDPYGLWSVSLQGYVGFGGGVVLTGTGFSLNSIGFRLGYGIGGGLDINPFGGKPDENAPSGSNSLGVFGEASAGVGPLAAGLGFNGGFTDKVDPDFTSHFCGYGGLEPELTSGKGHGWPFRFGGFELEGEASAGVELTHNF